MPRHKSAKQRMKTNARDTARNRAVLSQVRAVVKSVRAAKGPEAASSYAKASSALDRAVAKGIVKKSTANRHKSRLARAVAGSV